MLDPAHALAWLNRGLVRVTNRNGNRFDGFQSVPPDPMFSNVKWWPGSPERGIVEVSWNTLGSSRAFVADLLGQKVAA